MNQKAVPCLCGCLKSDPSYCNISTCPCFGCTPCSQYPCYDPGFHLFPDWHFTTRRPGRVSADGIWHFRHPTEQQHPPWTVSVSIDSAYGTAAPRTVPRYINQHEYDHACYHGWMSLMPPAAPERRSRGGQCNFSETVAWVDKNLCPPNVACYLGWPLTQPPDMEGAGVPPPEAPMHAGGMPKPPSPRLFWSSRQWRCQLHHQGRSF
jgi:hypothetical protein